VPGKQEYVGRYRKASNTFAIFIPLELRKLLGWVNGDHLIIVPHGNMLMITRIDKSMLLDRQREPGTIQTFKREVTP
jgi:bifunctional DNA-binding transcriptional regulator/antitoxin component of YhaV-PrlF toxin-antitoxin module